MSTNDERRGQLYLNQDRTPLPNIRPVTHAEVMSVTGVCLWFCWVVPETMLQAFLNNHTCHLNTASLHSAEIKVHMFSLKNAVCSKWSFIHMSAYMCICTKRSNVSFRFVLLLLSAYVSWRQNVFSGAEAHWFQLEWYISKLWGSPCSISPSFYPKLLSSQLLTELE